MLSSFDLSRCGHGCMSLTTFLQQATKLLFQFLKVCLLHPEGTPSVSFATHPEKAAFVDFLIGVWLFLLTGLRPYNLEVDRSSFH
jgi:hypothetical protein